MEANIPYYHRVLIFLLALAINLHVDVEGCKCRMSKPGTTWCNSDWVARVKINSRKDAQKMPPGITDRQIPSNTKYEVEYVHIFKGGETDANKTMNKTIFTPMEDGSCGLLLEEKHQYLLSGRFINGTMLTTICSQILLEDLKESRKHDILEWNEVPEELQQKLHSNKFASLCQQK